MAATVFVLFFLFLQFQTVLLVLDRGTDGQKYFIELFLFFLIMLFNV